MSVPHDSPVERARRALDPARSVVVEACAGIGKTWLLVSRLLRLLLAGARPGEILAITYTRKAAREIEERLRQWLRLLAGAPDAAVLDFLSERGLEAAAAQAALPRARGLLEAVLGAEPPMTITTFHGWFARIVGGAPFGSGLAGFRLSEAEAPLLDEAWARFARSCAAEPAGVEAAALLRLFDTVGAARTRALLQAFVNRRAEWHAYLDDGRDGLDVALARLQADLGVVAPGAALPAFLATAGLAEAVEALARLLDANTDSDRARAAALRAGFAADDAATRFAALKAAVLTQKGEPRAVKASAAQAKRLGEAGQTRFLDLHGRLTDQILAAADAVLEEHIFVLNRDVLVAAGGLLHALEAHKAERRLMDFADLEWHTDRLLSDPEQAPFLQARLDARYRHILLDEFQDTNPLQWRILVAWLDAYGLDGTPPRIFMVGDPKQSIYRFRRADFRIFTHAAEWLARRFDADRLANDATFRNAPAVVEVVNSLFAHEPAFVGFRPQTAVRAGLPGQVRLLPLIEDDEAAGGTASNVATDALRDPLRVAPVLAENLRRRREALAVAEHISALVGRWQVAGEHGPRPARYGDVLILTRRRSVLPEFERALRDAGIPYLSVSRGGLLKTLEAADLVALLRWLASPADDLALVHALRSPVFGVSDDALLRLAARPEAGWWARLGAMLAEGAADAALERAGHRLADWKTQAATLPVHDLLDRIFHEGQVLARYHAVVPPPMAAGVRANLEAFIALALELDGGRYPSLPRFIDELGRLSGAGDDEAPDEGLIPGDGDDADGRVRIMTIHGAKGLEAPVVWLIDARNGHQKPDTDQVLLDWPPGEIRPRHFSLATKKDERGRCRAALFEAEEQARAREDLNLLYVAITRASQYFLASGSLPTRDAAAPNPYQRIAAALGRLGAEAGTWGAPPVEVAAAPALAPAVEAEVAPTIAPVPVGQYRSVVDAVAGSAGTLFGTAFHTALECLTEARSTAGLDPAAVELAGRLVARPQLARFFDPAACRWARNEVEFVDAAGRLGRIDRLVDDGESLWVVDYKTGAPDERLLDVYRAQVRTYGRAVAALWPGRPLRAVLVFAGGEAIEVAVDEAGNAA